jgi:S-adenosylmethionine-diacylglycerol 3-amino-3-carboxypropyl transferase
VKIANGFVDHVHNRMFGALYGRSLIFNTCWEDPAVDRQALELGLDDSVLVITSAGCNALDYALAGPRAVHAVDANPRQTALLELKLVGIRRLSYEEFWRVFGEGRHADFRRLYDEHLRADLSAFAQRYWDRRCRWFEGRGWRNRFYFHGLTGLFARLLHTYLAARPGLRGAVRDLLDARDLAEQREIFDRRVEPVLWNRGLDWALRRPFTMTLLGVPAAQRREIEEQYDGDLPAFIREILQHVFRNVPLRENYFWTLYMRGHYTPDCCPEYLRPENFDALRAGLADRVRHHTGTVTDFLRTTDDRISRFVLLDHMDWLGRTDRDALADEWSAIMDRATPDARVIFRSGAARPTFLDDLMVERDGSGTTRLVEHLVFDRGRADELDRQDRVCTYASFHIAAIAGAA